MPLSADQVRQILTINGVVIEDSQWLLLERWVQSLLEVNRSINLISRKDTEFIWEHHILHSLSLLTVHPLLGDSMVCDFGCGGGLPGVPLGIVRPDLEVTLLDSRQKKICFLEKNASTTALIESENCGGKRRRIGEIS